MTTDGVPNTPAVNGCSPAAVASSAKTKPSRRAFSDLDAAIAASFGPRSWLFEGAVEGAPIIVFTGPEKKAKSWTWIDAAVAAASGGTWLGVFPCRRPGPVLYLDGEYGPVEFARRLARICKGRGLAPKDVIPHVHHYASWDLLFAAGDDALGWVLDQCKTIRPVLIVIDPWRNHLPGEENSTPDTIAAMRLVAKLREASGATVALVHHLNKRGVQSGARALLTRADLIIEGTDDDEPWYASKGRTIRANDRIKRDFTIHVDHEHDDDEPRARTILRARFEGDNRPAIGTMGASTRKVLSALQEATAPLGINGLKRASGVKNTKVLHASLKELERARLAVEHGGKWSWVDGTEVSQ